MSVLDRSALEASPLSDLHAIASELGLDGFRRLRRPELIDAILARQEGVAADPSEGPRTVEAAEEGVTDEGAQPQPRPRRRGARGRGRPRADQSQQAAAEPADAEAPSET